MKSTASNISERRMTQLAQRLSLGRIMEGSFGSGEMTASYRHNRRKAGWTAEQLITMSTAKSFYN